MSKEEINPSLKRKIEIQQHAISKFKEHPKGWYILTMGLGKSKIMIDVIKYLHTQGDVYKHEIPFLICVNSTELKDRNLIAEFDKWDLPGDIRKHVRIECYQTTRKWKKKDIGCLLADEADFSLTGAYSRIYTQNTFKYFMGLTGTLVDDKLEMATAIAPIRMVYDTHQAIQEGVINDIRILVHKVPLLKSRTDDYPLGENEFYAACERRITSSRIAYLHHLREAKAATDAGEAAYHRKEAKKAQSSKSWFETGGNNPNSRDKFLYGNGTNIRYVKALIKYLLEKDEQNKVLVFSKFSKHLDQVTPNGYHQNNPDETLIPKFNEGKIREIGAIKKVNRGVNFVGLNQTILHAFDSSMTNFAQGGVGRSLRLSPGDIADVHIVINTYWDSRRKKRRNCHNVKWAESFLNALGFCNIQFVDVEDLQSKMFED